MSNFANIPFENSFEAILTQELADSASALTIYVSKVPNFTFPVGAKVRMTINPKKNFTLQEDVLVESYDTVLKSLTVSVGGRAQARYNGDTPTPIFHTVGSKIIISDPFGVWDELKTSISSKAETAGAIFTGPVSFSGATTTFQVPLLTTAQRDALPSPQNGMLIYNTTTGTAQLFDSGVWVNIDTGSTPVVNASETAAGIVEEATQAENDSGGTTGGTGAKIFATPAKNAKTIQDSKWTFAADAGASDAYVITLTPAPTAYVTGQVFYFKANTANTGAATLNVNGLGAKTIKRQFNVDLSTGDIFAGQINCVVYDGTNFQLLSIISTTSPIPSLTDNFTLGEVIAANESVALNGDGLVYRAQSDVLNDCFTLIGTQKDGGVANDVRAVNIAGPTVTVPALTATQARLWTGQTQNVNNSTVSVFGVNWYAQTFTPATGQSRVDEVDIHLTLVGAPADDYILGIRATAAGLPTGADLASVTINSASLTTGLNRFSGFNLTVTPGTVYALVLRSPTAINTDNFAWGLQTTNVYAGGNRVDSVNSGVNWSAVAGQDFRFIVYFNASAGSDVYLLNSEGAINHLPGNFFQRIGRATASTKVMLFPGEPSIYATFSWGSSGINTTIDTVVSIGFRPKMVMAYGAIGAFGSFGLWHHGLTSGKTYGTLLNRLNNTTSTTAEQQGVGVGWASLTDAAQTVLSVFAVGADNITIRRVMTTGIGNAPAGSIHLAIFG